jgi:hypothetical protein
MMIAYELHLLQQFIKFIEVLGFKRFIIENAS